MDLFGKTGNGATFSECKKYRYALWRIWDESKPIVMFIGLNPSTANKAKNDPTIIRVKKLSSALGFGGFYMMNLFGFVTAYPEKLKAESNPVGDNDIWLENISKKCKKIIFAWGAFPAATNRANQVLKKYKGFALKINNDGSPRHPLYVKTDVNLLYYNNKPNKSKLSTMEKFHNLFIPLSNHKRGDKGDGCKKTIPTACSYISCKECLFASRNKEFFNLWNNYEDSDPIIIMISKILNLKTDYKINKVRLHLLRGKSLSDFDSISIYKYKRLSDVVCKLRKKLNLIGYDIKTVMAPGRTGDYAVYSLIKIEEDK